jgi:hypothetical protein
MSGSRTLTLDVFEDPPHRSQEPAFLEVQDAMREAHEPEFLELRGIALRIAAESGGEGFTVDELMDAAGGRGRYPKNLPGVVLGNLRSKHAICVISREKATHPAAKGRWVNRFKLNSEAIRVDE